MARFGPSILRHEGLPRDIELAMCDVIEKEIALQRTLESCKADLAACVEYNSSSAFATIDALRLGVLTTVNVNDFMRSQGAILTELELVAIIRRMATDGNCAITLGEFAEFMRPLVGVKLVSVSPVRTVSTRYSSPVRVRTTTTLLESPVALTRSLSVERRVPVVTTVTSSPSRFYDLDYPAYKYRYLADPYWRTPLTTSVATRTILPYTSYVSPYSYSRYLPYSSYVSPYYRQYWSTGLGRYVAV